MWRPLEDIYAVYSTMTDYGTEYDSGRIEEFVDKYLHDALLAVELGTLRQNLHYRIKRYDIRLKN